MCNLVDPSKTITLEGIIQIPVRFYTSEDSPNRVVIADKEAEKIIEYFMEYVLRYEPKYQYLNESISVLSFKYLFQ